MEQERQRSEHEAAKQRLKEKQEANAQEQARLQAQQPVYIPKHQAIMAKQNDAKVVGRYKIIKKENQDK